MKKNAFTVQHCLQPCEKMHPGEDVQHLTVPVWKPSLPSLGLSGTSLTPAQDMAMMT